MKQIDNVKFFLDEFDKYREKFKLGYVELKQDNRLGKRYICKTTCYSWIDTEELFPVVFYNTKLIKKTNQCELLQTIFHEIGHIFYGHIYSTDNTKIAEFEYQAEKFSFEAIKSNYPELIDIAITNLKDMAQNYSKVYRNLARQILTEEGYYGI